MQNHPRSPRKKSRSRALIWVAGAALALIATSVSANVAATPDEDRERTWAAAEIWGPPAVTGFFRTDMTDALAHDRLSDLAAQGNKMPTVLFLHGCTAGRKPAGWTMARHLARAGYAVILPDSFARTARPQTCDRWSFTPTDTAPKTRADILALRRAELDLALERARALPWVDGDNLFVIGYDEGADALAAWDGNGHVRARVLISTLCPEGLAGTHLATLTLGATADPLLGGRSPSTCATFGPSEQKNFETTFHDLTGLAAAREEILSFLSRHRTTKP